MGDVHPMMHLQLMNRGLFKWGWVCTAMLGWNMGCTGTSEMSGQCHSALFVKSWKGRRICSFGLCQQTLLSLNWAKVNVCQGGGSQDEGTLYSIFCSSALGAIYWQNLVLPAEYNQPPEWSSVAWISSCCVCSPLLSWRLKPKWSSPLLLPSLQQVPWNLSARIYTEIPAPIPFQEWKVFFLTFIRLFSV